MPKPPLINGQDRKWYRNLLETECKVTEYTEEKDGVVRAFREIVSLKMKPNMWDQLTPLTGEFTITVN